jgi:hypothetical protein
VHPGSARDAAGKARVETFELWPGETSKVGHKRIDSEYRSVPA